MFLLIPNTLTNPAREDCIRLLLEVKGVQLEVPDIWSALGQQLKAAAAGKCKVDLDLDGTNPSCPCTQCLEGGVMNRGGGGPQPQGNSSERDWGLLPVGHRKAGSTSGRRGEVV